MTDTRRCPNSELTTHLRLADAAVAETSPYPDGRYSGRGIVTCAGGVKYFPSAWVLINMLRHLGCTLPVELWHLGRHELTEDMAELVKPLGVTCVDAHEVRERYPSRILNGWEVKPYSIIHSGFEEVLFLDADNVPVVNPGFLFDTPQYREFGAVFWPDYWRLSRNRAIWKVCGVSYRDEPEFESGQILLHKRRCWQALQLTMCYNEYSDYYYQYMYGDKETYHMAWRRLDQEYAMPREGVCSLGGCVMLQRDFEGHLLFQHRNRAKWHLDPAQNPRIDGFLYEDTCIEFLRQFLPDQTIGEGAAALEKTWRLDEKADGDLTLGLCGDAGLICELERGADGAWRGRWTQFERMPIELVPVQDVTLKEAVAHPCNAQLQPLRTVLVFVWFGPYPPIYHLTVRSACQSGVSQILLYGDEPPCLYPNLRWVPQTMGDVTRRVRRVLPEAPEYNDPYKLCDLKPLYYFMFEEDIADFDYWMWQDLDAMCGSFNMVCPFLDGSVHALSHHPRDLGGHWQLFSSDVFRGRSGFWKSQYARAKDRFQDANTIHRMDEAWLHEVLHQEDVEHLHVPSLEKMGGVYYVDSHLIKPGEGEFWTYHFLHRYKRPSYPSVSRETFESNHLAICDKDSDPFRLMAEDEARACLSHG